ncbi:uncharacterized protein LOC131060988 [Cryptomeria japonica]|uniref:uncharacterized protein LOC131060988 n=1 Tax=Cryptomeria japonica TaxID=3369 RepID=UPI0025AD54D0|nr:uncharacterized protein LOC131060988 [Cryptomeria japonica]
MALLSPVTFDISFLRFNGGSPVQCVKFPSMQAKFRTRAQQEDQFPPQNNDQMSPAVKRAFEKAQLYKKKREGAQQSAQNDAPQLPSSQGDTVSDTFDQSKAYGWKQGEKSRTKEDNAADKESETDNAKEDNIVEVEIITRDGVIKRKYTPTSQASSNMKDYRRKGISSIDFVGLDFADKKSKRELPAGLKAVPQSPPSGSMPEAELIVGDVSKFGVTTPEKDNEISDLYKPKVSTWGVFPRPKNISKAYGGGKVIRPGGVLESKEEKEAREARTKKLTDAYKEKMGENVDPKVKAKCEKVKGENAII